ncbi:MAG: metal-dependent protease of the PAD1/JAB1 superfamily [bacterium]|nr:MAG: metal-dependent protease of the PAD1/JAB1 superfamily [bacterium]
MILHAKNSVPEECCAFLGGEKDTFTSYYPLKNCAEDRQKFFVVAPLEIFQTLQQMGKTRQGLLGIYHSHPKSIAYPSTTDIELALYPKAVYFILSLQPIEKLAAFSIQQKKVTSLEICII